MPMHKTWVKGNGLRLFNLLTQVKEKEGMERQTSIQSIEPGPRDFCPEYGLGALCMDSQWPRFGAPDGRLSFHSFFLFHLFQQIK